MYKPVKPIKCPNCGEIVQVDTSMILTSYPPQYKWECPKCGRTGYTKQGDIITFENQIGGGTSGYIQKVDEPDPGVGVTTTNADDIKAINIIKEKQRMLKFYMKDGVTIKSSTDYNLGELKNLIADRYTISSNDTNKVFMLTNLPLFGIVCDTSGKKVFINMDNVLYIEEVKQ